MDLGLKYNRRLFSKLLSEKPGWLDGINSKKRFQGDYGWFRTIPMHCRGSGELDLSQGNAYEQSVRKVTEIFILGLN